MGNANVDVNWPASEVTGMSTTTLTSAAESGRSRATVTMCLTPDGASIVLAVAEV